MPLPVRWLLAAIAAGVIGAVVGAPVIDVLSGTPIPHKKLVRLLKAHVPLWIVFAVGLVLLGAYLRSRAKDGVSSKRLLGPLQEEHAEARQEIRRLAAEQEQLLSRVERDAIFTRALGDVFNHLEALLIKESHEMARSIEKAVLEPMCGVFSEQQSAVVKMAVLEVAPDEPFEYRMPMHVNWGADADTFRWSTADPLDNIGFETGERILACPIICGGKTDAMLLAMAPATFPPEDRDYVVLVAAAIGLLRTANRRDS
jgi:hypothetical protein